LSMHASSSGVSIFKSSCFQIYNSRDCEEIRNHWFCVKKKQKKTKTKAYTTRSAIFQLDHLATN
ncbi:hypothetical protein L9F63_007739, partial [Diploptera punctata]